MTWREAKDSSGRIYYYNSETKKSTWDKPKELYTRQDELLEKSQWKQYFSKENKKYYYYNLETKQTTWEFPIMDEKKSDGSDVVMTENKESSPQPKEDKQENKSYQPLTSSKASKKLNYEKIFARDTALVNVGGSSNNDSNGAQQRRFKDLLEENGVDTTWSFQKVMDSLITDPRYWLISDPLAKKNLYEEYLIEKSRKEILKVSNSKEKFQNDFKKLLQSHSKNIKYYTRWKTIRHLISDEPIYNHSILSEREKKNIFLDYVNVLRKQHDDEEHKLKLQALSEFQEYFDSTLKNNFTISYNWDDVLEIIANDQRIKQNKNFKRLNKLDILKIYSKQYAIYENDIKKKVEDLSAKNFRSDRIARDEYKKLLNEMKNNDLITINTTFQDIYPFIKNEESFKNLLGRSSLLPLHLFWDLIEEQHILLRAQKDIVFNFLVEKNFNILTHSKKEFLGLISKGEQLPNISDNEENLKFFQDQLGRIYSLLVKQNLNDLKKQKYSLESRFEVKKSTFKKYLIHRLRENHLSGDTSAAKLKSLNELDWPNIKSQISQESYYTSLTTYVQRHYKLLFDDAFAKKLEYDTFIQHNEQNEQGNEDLDISENVVNPEKEELILHQLFQQLVGAVREEIITAEKNLIAAKPSSLMDLDY